ncbi:MAG: hypothetical protein ACOH1Y_16215 [Propionicimonas sp.]
MQIGDDQGQLLTMIARLVGARRPVEVGTLTGYSRLRITRGLAEGGSLLWLRHQRCLDGHRRPVLGGGVAG